MLYIPGVLNPKASLTSGSYLKIFLAGSATRLILCFASILMSRLSWQFLLAVTGI
jgi:hypothetical protein